MNYVDNVYVINMDNSSDRLEIMKSQIDIIGKPFNRISAVVGKNLKKEDIKNETTSLCNLICTNTMIGIFMSHKKTWETIINNNDKYAMIMEDDCSLIPTFKEDLKECLDELFIVDPEWDFLYVGCFGGCDPDTSRYTLIEKLQNIVLNKNIKKKQNNLYSFTPETPIGFHCYIISQKCAKKMLKVLNKVSYHVDVAFLNNAKTFNIYACSKTLAYQYSTSKNSSQTENFPIILNSLFENIKCRKEITYSYYLSSPIIGIYKYNINTYLLIFLIIALITPYSYKNYLFYIFTLYFLLELIIKTSNYHYIMFWSILILSIFIIKIIFYRIYS